MRYAGGVKYLKHRKDLLDFIDWTISIAVTAVLLTWLCNPTPAFWINQWIRDSFQLTQNNYYVLLSVYGERGCAGEIYPDI